MEGYCEANGGANAWYLGVKPVTATGSDLTRCLEYYRMTHFKSLCLILNCYIKSTFRVVVLEEGAYFTI